MQDARVEATNNDIKVTFKNSFIVFRDNFWMHNTDLQGILEEERGNFVQ
jgi:hypothetical protein